MGTYSNFPDLAPVVLQCGWGFSSAARGRFRRFPFDSTHSADRKDQRGAVSMLSLYSAASFQRLAAVDGVESLTSILVPMYSPTTTQTFLDFRWIVMVQGRSHTMTVSSRCIIGPKPSGKSPLAGTSVPGSGKISRAAKRSPAPEDSGAGRDWLALGPVSSCVITMVGTTKFAQGSYNLGSKLSGLLRNDRQRSAWRMGRPALQDADALP